MKANSSEPIEISVVTASYNQGRFIRDCIESVKAQGLERVEHIVIDGGSTDETLDILRSYDHLEWISEPDKGQSDAINKGIRLARGRWILWLNSDDYILPGVFDDARRAISQDPDVDFVFGWLYLVDARRRFIKSVRFPPIKNNLMRYWASLPSTGTFYNRRLFHEYGLWLDQKLSILMDLDLFARSDRYRAKFVNLNRFVVAFRWHGENVSMKRHLMTGDAARKRWQEHLAERRLIVDKCIALAIPNSTIKYCLWKAGSALMKQHWRFQKLVRGQYLMDLADQVIMKQREIKPAEVE